MVLRSRTRVGESPRNLCYPVLMSAAEIPLVAPETPGQEDYYRLDYYRFRFKSLGTAFKQ
jgi:hypothetical protein